MDISTIILFALACVALSTSPGPDMVLIASRTISQGRKAGFVTLAGAQVGTYVHAAAAAFGLSQLFLLVPVAYDLVRWAGAAYLLYLAWTTLRSAGDVVDEHHKSRSITPLFQIFRQGLLTNLLNPKMALFILALFPQFVKVESGLVALQIMVLATIINLVGLVVNGTVIMIAGHTKNLFAKGGRFATLPKYLLSAVFTGLALRLAWDSRE